MRKTSNKEVNKLMRQAVREGWIFTSGNGHIKGKHPDGRTTTISVSSSDVNSHRWIAKQLGLK